MVIPGGTVFDQLNAHHLSWKFYAQGYKAGVQPSKAQITRNPLLVMPAFQHDPRLVDTSQYFVDLDKGQLPEVSYVTAATTDSERSPQDPAQGEAFVRSLVNALMQSSEWSHTALLLTYDDSGGWYDHVEPPGVAGTTLGVRVPTLLISPYAKPGYVDSTTTDSASIPGFIDDVFKLPAITPAVNEVGSVMSAVDTTQRPNPPIIGPSEGTLAPIPRPKVATVYLLYLGALVAAALLLIIAFIRQRRPDHPVLASATRGEAVPLPGLGSAGTTRRDKRWRGRRPPPPPTTGGPGRATARITLRQDPVGPADQRHHSHGPVGMSALRLPRLAACFAAVALTSAAMTAASPAAQAVVPATRTVQVQVVPALPGVAFTLDGHSYVTGPGGTAVVDDAQLNGAAERLTVTPNQVVAGGPGTGVRVSLDRVATDPNHGPFTRKLVAELDEDQQVTMSFSAPKNPATTKVTAVPLRQVSSVTLTDSLGGTLHYTGAELAAPVWLPASRPALASAGANGRLVTYAFKSVVMRGANVVNSGQRRFTPYKQPTWEVPVILHSLTIEANDLLAGAPAGKTAQLTFPDNSVETVPLGPQHKVTLYNLPRGTYQLKVGGGLIALSSTVRLSRDQTATEVVITGADAGELGLMLFSVLAVVVAAGVIGRRLRRQAADRREGTASALLA